MNTKVLIFILIAVILVIAIIAFSKSPKASPIGKDKTEVKNVVKKLNYDLMLKKGSKGSEVSELQKFLNEKNISPLARLKVDGDFGSLTENMLNNTLGVKQITLRDAGTRLYGFSFKLKD